MGSPHKCDGRLIDVESDEEMEPTRDKVFQAEIVSGVEAKLIPIVVPTEAEDEPEVSPLAVARSPSPQNSLLVNQVEDASAENAEAEQAKEPVLDESENVETSVPVEASVESRGAENTGILSNTTNLPTSPNSVNSSATGASSSLGMPFPLN